MGRHARLRGPRPRLVLFLALWCLSAVSGLQLTPRTRPLAQTSRLFVPRQGAVPQRRVAVWPRAAAFAATAAGVLAPPVAGAAESLAVSLGKTVLPSAASSAGAGASAGGWGIGMALASLVGGILGGIKALVLLLLKLALPAGFIVGVGFLVASGLLGDAAGGVAQTAKVGAQRLGAGLRGVAGVLTGAVSGITGIGGSFAGETKELDPLDWFACTLDGVTAVGDTGRWLKYRFKLKDKRVALPLNIAQGVTLCGLDDEDRVVRMDLAVASPREAKGYFEVLVRKDDLEPMVQVLQVLSTGDEIAAKCGPQRLDYSSEHQVTNIVSLVRAEGVVPALGIARELLPQKNTGIEAFNLVWVNSAEEDFVLYDDVERLFYRHQKQMDVSCVVERDLNALDQNAAMLEAVPEWEPGIMGVIAGDPNFCVAARAFLGSARGYPPSTVCTLA